MWTGERREEVTERKIESEDEEEKWIFDVPRPLSLDIPRVRDGYISHKNKKKKKSVIQKRTEVEMGENGKCWVRKHWTWGNLYQTD